MLPMRPRVHLPGRTGRQNRHALPGVRPSDSRYNGASLRGSLLFAIRPQTGKRHENAPRPASRQKKRTSFSGRDTDERGIRQENLPQRPAAASGRRIPATSWLAWGLSLIALILAFIFPSYGNGSTDPLYMLQCLPSIVFGCTAAILFIQGLAAMRR